MKGGKATLKKAVLQTKKRRRANPPLPRPNGSERKALLVKIQVTNHSTPNVLMVTSDRRNAAHPSASLTRKPTAANQTGRGPLPSIDDTKRRPTR
jgi:hypothetical protein